MQKDPRKVREYLGQWGRNKAPIWVQIQVGTADVCDNPATGKPEAYCHARLEPDGPWQFQRVPIPKEWWDKSEPENEKQPMLALLIWCQVEMPTDIDIQE